MKEYTNHKFNFESGLINILVFIVFLVVKLTEKCTFWNGSFPRFLMSTESWWDGWFMVFLPLWIGVPIVLILLIIFIIIALIDEYK